MDMKISNLIDTLNRPLKPAAVSENERLKKACTDFEGIFLNCMLKSMRKTLSGDSVFGGGLQKDIYESMYDQQLTTDIASGGSRLGISASLYRELQKKMDMGPGNSINAHI